MYMTHWHFALTHCSVASWAYMLKIFCGTVSDLQKKSWTALSSLIILFLFISVEAMNGIQSKTNSRPNSQPKTTVAVSSNDSFLFLLWNLQLPRSCNEGQPAKQQHTNNNSNNIMFCYIPFSLLTVSTEHGILSTIQPRKQQASKQRQWFVPPPCLSLPLPPPPPLPPLSPAFSFMPSRLSKLYYRPSQTHQVDNTTGQAKPTK